MKNLTILVAIILFGFFSSTVYADTTSIKMWNSFTDKEKIILATGYMTGLVKGISLGSRATASTVKASEEETYKILKSIENIENYMSKKNISEVVVLADLLVKEYPNKNLEDIFNLIFAKYVVDMDKEMK